MRSPVLFVILSFVGCARVDDAFTASSEPAFSTGARVQVVDDDTGAPIPHSVLHYVEGDAWDRHWGDGRLRITMSSLWEVAEQLGERIVADAHGRARVAWTGMEAMVTARASDGSIGLASVDAWHVERDPIMVRVPRRRDLRVLVVDEQGKPAPDVRVGLWFFMKGPHTMARARTGADGIANLGQVAGLAALPYAVNSLLVDETIWGDGLFAVGLEVPGTGRGFLFVPSRRDGPASREIDPRHPPTDPIELRLVPTGRVVVNVRDRNGDPPPVSQPVCLSVAGGEAELLGEVPRVGRDHDVAWTDALGRATIPHVALGHSYGARTWDAIRNESAGVHLAGPQKPGETVEVSLLWPAAPSPRLIRGRAVDIAGRPLSNALLDLAAFPLGQPEASEGYGTRWMTDAQGRFELSSAEHHRRSLGWDYDEAARSAHPPGFDLIVKSLNPARIGRQTLEPFTGPVANAGDVVLEAAEIVASGRVVGPSGQPLEGAHVRAYGAWHTAVTDGGGHWVIRSWPWSHPWLEPTPPSPEPFTLSVWHPDYARAETPKLRWGTPEVNVTLQPSARRRIRLRTTPFDGPPPRRIFAEFEGVRDLAYIELQPAGSRLVGSAIMDRGKYELEVFDGAIVGGDRKLRMRRSLVTQESDSDAIEIDLGPYFTRLSLEVVDRHGDSIQEVVVGGRDEGERQRVLANDGRAVVLVSNDRGWIGVSSPGFGSTTVATRDGGGRVVLGPVLRVPARLVGPAIPEGYTLELVAYGADERTLALDIWPRGGHTVVDAAGNAEIIVPGAGLYDVRLVVWKDGWRSRVKSVRSELATASQTIEVAYTDEELRSALKKLGR